ncbi:hypothetical protein [Engelhardtia mirabilis]|uniref:Uncharacterized protein n=1 Tax=Engelhardtia mirabilis TaxID=2528011 RepID=A0A518BFL2_9BACT|nr:hypothetical protein Pla133_08270 [Planctomycetes bacterium Pla133]QDV00087.1 hypothetical protein Pla86_08260 [Planctomycetes bacterium Pla86]
MSDLPDRETLRQTIAGFDSTRQKVLGGMVLAMINQPDAIQDREWLSEGLAQMAARALELPDAPGPAELELLRAWILEHRDAVLNAAFAVFVRSAEDIQEAGALEGLTFERASAAALVYLAPEPED